MEHVSYALACSTFILHFFYWKLLITIFNLAIHDISLKTYFVISQSSQTDQKMENKSMKLISFKKYNICTKSLNLN